MKMKMTEWSILRRMGLQRDATGERIAETLYLSPETVQKHVHNAKRKLGAATRAHMIALAIKHGVIDPG